MSNLALCGMTPGGTMTARPVYAVRAGSIFLTKRSWTGTSRNR